MSEIAFVVQFAHAILLVRVLETCPVLLSVFFFVGWCALFSFPWCCWLLHFFIFRWKFHTRCVHIISFPTKAFRNTFTKARLRGHSLGKSCCHYYTDICIYIGRSGGSRLFLAEPRNWPCVCKVIGGHLPCSVPLGIHNFELEFCWSVECFKQQSVKQFRRSWYAVSSLALDSLLGDCAEVLFFNTLLASTLYSQLYHFCMPGTPLVLCQLSPVAGSTQFEDAAQQLPSSALAQVVIDRGEAEYTERTWPHENWPSN